MNVRAVVAECRALVAPPVCVVCRAAITHAEEVLCMRCRRALPWLLGSLCARCALPEPCTPCPAQRSAVDRAWAPLAHEGIARRMVAALKFQARLAVADAMAGQMVAGAPEGMLDGVTVVPVASDSQRRRRQGYGHAEVLARRFAARARLPLAACLRRSPGSARQLGSSRAARLAPDRTGLWAATRAPPVAVLIDDVHTTGATLHACACALRAAGAERVMAITYTRTL